MENINTDIRRTCKILAKLFKMRKPRGNSFDKGRLVTMSNQKIVLVQNLSKTRKNSQP